jgi:hypothetical protein
MSETPTLCESSVNDPEVVVAGFELPLGPPSPGFSGTQTPVNEPAEVKPVSWDGLHDPKNPQNWSPSRKWLVMSVNSIITVNV